MEVIGDKKVCDITRDDILAYRDWWLARIDDEHMVPGTANKNFIQVKVVIDTLNDHGRLGLDTGHLLKSCCCPRIARQDGFRLPPILLLVRY